MIILTNDDEVCTPSLSSILLAVLCIWFVRCIMLQLKHLIICTLIAPVMLETCEDEKIEGEEKKVQWRF